MVALDSPLGWIGMWEPIKDWSYAAKRNLAEAIWSKV